MNKLEKKVGLLFLLAALLPLTSLNSVGAEEFITTGNITAQTDIINQDINITKVASTQGGKSISLNSFKPYFLNFLRNW